MYNQYNTLGNRFIPYQNPNGRAYRTRRNFNGFQNYQFNWSSFLDNTRRTLEVINQVIPLVYQIRPILNNAKTMFKIASVISEEKQEECDTTRMSSSKQQCINNQPQFFI